MIQYWRRRQRRKRVGELLKHARHVRHMREDLMTASQLAALEADEATLRSALVEGGDEAIERASDALVARVTDLTPTRAFPSVRENIEVIVVAVAVAMAFRTYFIQPFKIPTGSMQPTLYGITALDKPVPGFSDRLPFRYLKWFVTGELYREVKVKVGGTLSERHDGNPDYPGDYFYVIAGHRYRVPRDARLNYEVNAYVPRGAVLWSGSRTAGDHVFVDKVSWNFRRPRRGDIMVFITRGITELEEGLPRDRQGAPIMTHYIKRMCGLPGETIAIRPPELIVNDGEIPREKTIRRIAQQATGYAGFQVIGNYPGRLRFPGESIRLGATEYLALGDNTLNSKDSRYWGPVQRENLVGPACLIYWPFVSARRKAPPGRNGWQVGRIN